MFTFTLLLSFAVILIDQVIKFFAFSHLKYIESIKLMNGIVELVYLENRGVAFGIFENWHLFFVILIPIIIATFLIIIKKVNINSVLFSLSSALIIGGGIGNLIDRIIRGYVIDYIRLSFFSPVCNFADYCISVGTALLIIYILFFHKKSLSKTT